MDLDITRGSGNPRCLRLRVSVGDGVHRDFNVSRPEVRVGSAEDNDIVLEGADVSPYHLELGFVRGVWVLRVRVGAERVHVNARPVRELALLHLGDTISLSRHKLRLLPMQDTMDPPPRVRRDQAAAPTRRLLGLRCVAGPMSGQFFPVRPDLLLDGSLLPGMEACLRLHGNGPGIDFELMGQATDLPACNGLPVRGGYMRHGDQLTWGRHRFLLEGGATAVPPVAPVRSPDTGDHHDQAQVRQVGREIAWLLLVAGLLAACIAGLLLLRQ